MKRISLPDAGAGRARLLRETFNRPTLAVARDLIGKFILHRTGNRIWCGMITETEAYKGPRDRAAHSYGGRRTRRVESLYGEGGTVYVYFIYGIHWMLNLSTAGRELPEGVLIRGIAAVDDDPTPRVLAGPGKVTRYLQVDRTLDREDSVSSDRIWLEDRGVRVPRKLIRRGPRIGVDYAGPYWAGRPWRYWIEPRVALLMLERLHSGPAARSNSPKPMNRTGQSSSNQ